MVSGFHCPSIHFFGYGRGSWGSGPEGVDDLCIHIWGIFFSLRPSVRPYVHPSVRNTFSKIVIYPSGTHLLVNYWPCWNWNGTGDLLYTFSGSAAHSHSPPRAKARDRASANCKSSSSCSINLRIRVVDKPSGRDKQNPRVFLGKRQNAQGASVIDYLSSVGTFEGFDKRGNNYS